MKPSALDFFAGSGLVSEALKSHFEIVWANDVCEKKAAVYRANHPNDAFHLGSIESVRGADLPAADLSWASFPCQDLSLAGNLGGLDKARSGLVWQWLRVMDEMPERPKLVVAENVIGLLSAGQGRYYRLLHSALVERGYRIGTLVLDAARWVPQSRPRVFVVGVDSRIATDDLEQDAPGWAQPSIISRASEGCEDWAWWRIPLPSKRRHTLQDIIDLDAPCDPPARSGRNLRLIPRRHREMLNSLSRDGVMVFPGYKRTRSAGQALELRFDGIAGCLRTPEGGSSRQVVVIVRDGSPKTRLLTVQETARLMGVRKSYKIPGTYNDGYKAMGDAVVVPAVRHLARHLLSPLALRIGEAEPLECQA